MGRNLGFFVIFSHHIPAYPSIRAALCPGIPHWLQLASNERQPPSGLHLLIYLFLIRCTRPSAKFYNSINWQKAGLSTRSNHMSAVWQYGVRAIIVLTAFQSNLVPPFWVGSESNDRARAPKLHCPWIPLVYIYISIYRYIYIYIAYQLWLPISVCVCRQQESAASMTLATKLWSFGAMDLCGGGYRPPPHTKSST